MTADLVTYDDAARWLPVHVRAAVELTVPCTLDVYGVGHHEWTTAFEIVEPAGTIRTWWVCAHCGDTTETDLRSAR